MKPFILFPEEYGPVHRYVHIVTRSGRVAQPPPVDRPFAGTLAREDVQRDDDEILHQLRTTQACISIWSLLASSITHRDALIRALSHIRVDTATTLEGIIHFLTTDRATCIRFHMMIYRPRGQIIFNPYSLMLLVQTFWCRLSYRTGGTDHALDTNGIQGIQQALRHMCFSFETIEAPGAMIVAPPSPGPASVFSMCFPKEVLDYDLSMDLRDDTDGVTIPDAYIDMMDMISISRILDAAPHEPHYAFDMFGVSVIDFEDVTLYDECADAMDMIGTSHILDAAQPGPCSVFYMFRISMQEINDDDGLITTDVIHNTVSLGGVSDSVDPPFSFDTMSGFVTRFDDISDGNNDMSIFEYWPMSQHFPLITPPTPTAHIYDVDDVGDTNDPLGGQSECDSNTEDKKVTPITGST